MVLSADSSREVGRRASDEVIGREAWGQGSTLEWNVQFQGNR